MYQWIRGLGNNCVLQPLWDCLRLNYTDWLRSPLFPVILTVSSYFVLCLPFLICDIMGEKWMWVQQFKIQPSRRPTASTLLHCAGVTLHNNVLLVLPASVAQWAWSPPVDLPECAPSLLEVIAGVIGNLLLFDFQYFIWHLLQDHCGYDFPWSTSRLIPFGIYGGPSKHDVHHQKPNTNFAPHFSHWDKIFGTHAEFSFSSAMK
ncbi:cholesterol 25-hydroxylase-like protein 1, member 2 isoform X2 [Takifugu rubripes]|uniref:cholesterol 25-hydroxylase-like protein 1, member 2 isoform X2 n=1 Tax=Takifugu rubripes TaxID=31033 RepID=UPI001145C1A0|nr:cholesterol 25-hydroxylase-like protein 1, member 2 isoform X2 [Takifugu rubripes]